MKNIQAMLHEKSFWILLGINFGIGILSGLFQKPFYLHFLNGCTISGVLTLMIGISILIWKEGEFAYFSWRKNKADSYTSYRTSIIENRKDVKNPWLFVGAFVTILIFVLSFLY